MVKKIILASIIIIILVISGIFLLNENTVNVYLDGENISVETKTLDNVDTHNLNKAICNYTLNVMNNSTANVETLKNGVSNLCRDYGLKNSKINIDSSLGPDQIPIKVYVNGTSMLPTLQDGQYALVNKTHDIDIGDIVVARSDEYGEVIKRVDQINGDNVHLVSDNKNISYEYINGYLYQIKGITTWVELSDIQGVVIDY